MARQDTQVYQALALPEEALANGGTEILRAGIIDGELYVTARRAFRNPSKWGDVLADMARRLALIYSAEDTNLREGEILTDILEAFAADLGARKIEKKPVRRKSPSKSAKRAVASRSTATAARTAKSKKMSSKTKSAKRSKR